MIKERVFVLPYLFNKKVDIWDRETMKDLIKEILVTCTHVLQCVCDEQGELYKDWFRRETTIQDWASFIQEYNIFEIYEKKSWNRQRIQNMRHLYDLVLRPKEWIPKIVLKEFFLLMIRFWKKDIISYKIILFSKVNIKKAIEEIK